MTQRKVLLSVILLLIVHLSIGQSINKIRISLKLENASIRQAIQEVEASTHFKFVARAEDIENSSKVNVDARDQYLDVVLDKIFSGTGLTYKQVENNIIIKKGAITRNKDKVSSGLSGSDRTVHGNVRSASSGETIIGATIAIPNSEFGTVTNEYGFFSITFPETYSKLEVSAVGMQPFVLSLDSIKVSRLEILLRDKEESLEMVTVTAAPGNNVAGSQMSMERISAEQIRNIPVLFGERDMMKTIQLLPGVKSAGEGNSGFYVRGGAADQNLILLDEAPVYNASHMLGFFSTFNSDAVKNVTLFKGGMPAQYGGRLSSVVDIKMNDGDNKEFGMSGGIGLIASRLNIEGPIQKDKSSFMVSGRRTYADVFLKLLGDSSLRSTRLYFYDLNVKANYQIGQKDKLYLSGYFGRDVLGQQDFAGINWGNSTGTLRWNHIFNNKVFSNTSLIFSNYDYKVEINSESTDYQIFSQIRDWNLKEEIQWYADSRNTVTMGFNSIYHTVRPGEISVTGNNGTSAQGQPDRYSLENNIYAGNTWKANEKWNIAYGIRLSAFSILGPGDYYNVDGEGKVMDTLQYGSGEVVKTYLNLEPRLSVGYQINSYSSVKGSYTRNTQNLHLISNTNSASPTDKWVASTNIIKPEIADQVAAGYYRRFGNTPYELSVEAYYKTMQNQIDYRDGANVYTNEIIETQLLFGKGRAYGIEWLFKKRTGKFNGWISYTLSKTERKINGINNGNWYNARQDRTHDIAIVGMYQLNRKWALSANWVYSTGDAVTYPSGKYRIDSEVYFYYSERNGYRMPDYHRLDLAATVQLRKSEKFSSELVLSLFNAYGRANAYQINFRESVDNPQKTEAVQTSLFTFVPSVTYNFKF